MEGEFSGPAVEAVQAAFGADPEDPFPVLMDAIRIVVAQAGRIGRIVAVTVEFPAGPVEAAEAAPVGGDPERAVAVLAHVMDVIASARPVGRERDSG